MWQKVLAALGLKAQDQFMAPSDYEFMRYVTEYGKQYETRSEFDLRAGIFAENLKTIEEHNSSGATFQLGLNHLSDYTESEYKQMLGYQPNLKPLTSAEPVLLSEEGLEAEVNWVTRVPSPVLRTKANADHAGPSLPLVPSKVPDKLPALD